VRTLFSKFPYRLDTNYAKMDRIRHSSLEVFKKKVLDTVYHNYKIEEWVKIIGDVEKPDNMDKLSKLIK
jgi:hypothetical protein